MDATAYFVCAKPSDTYEVRPESNDSVSVTDDRKGKRPTTASSVDIDEALKAEHAVDPSRDIQL